jgi:hypothetical protein
MMAIGRRLRGRRSSFSPPRWSADVLLQPCLRRFGCVGMAGVPRDVRVHVRRIGWRGSHRRLRYPLSARRAGHPDWCGACRLRRGHAGRVPQSACRPRYCRRVGGRGAWRGELHRVAGRRAGAGCRGVRHLFDPFRRLSRRTGFDTAALSHLDAARTYVRRHHAARRHRAWRAGRGPSPACLSSGRTTSNCAI